MMKDTAAQDSVRPKRILEVFYRISYGDGDKEPGFIFSIEAK